MFTETHAQFLAELERLRAKIVCQIPDANERKTLMGTLANDESLGFFVANGPEKWRTNADEQIAVHSS